jgi:hypothetical protein
MLRRTSAVALMFVALVGCRSDGQEPDPDLSAARSATWMNTAKELSGGKAGASVSGLGGSGMDATTSVVWEGLVLSAASTEQAEVIAAQSAKTGEIVWRRELPNGEHGRTDCKFGDDGSVFGCEVGKHKSSSLWIIDYRTGKVRAKLRQAQSKVFAVAGDDVYFATFKPTAKPGRFTLRLECRRWASGQTVWKKSFLTAEPDSEGYFGIAIGKNRVFASSGGFYGNFWQVIVDKSSGQLLERNRGDRWSVGLDNGGWIVRDGDLNDPPTEVTLFSPSGRSLARFAETYPSITEAGSKRVAIGRRILSLDTGQVMFTAPKRSRIVAVAAAGRLAVVEPDEAPDGKIPIVVYDTENGKRTGALTLSGISEESISSGNGLVKVVMHSDKGVGPPTSTVDIVDVRKPVRVASVDFGKASAGEWFTLARTSEGFAVTSDKAVRGFVAK